MVRRESRPAAASRLARRTWVLGRKPPRNSRPENSSDREARPVRPRAGADIMKRTQPSCLKTTQIHVSGASVYAFLSVMLNCSICRPTRKSSRYGLAAPTNPKAREGKKRLLWYRCPTYVFWMSETNIAERHHAQNPQTKLSRHATGPRTPQEKRKSRHYRRRELQASDDPSHPDRCQVGCYQRPQW